MEKKGAPRLPARSRRFAFKVLNFDSRNPSSASAPPSQTVAASHAQMPLHPRQIKSRSGCEPCKQRRIKCDEGQPQCQRCQKRNIICTGNFRAEKWQIERPWLYVSHEKVQSLGAILERGASEPAACQNLHLARPVENELLRHWFDHAWIFMGIVPQAENPLTYGIFSYLRRSRALRHSIQCISQAHLGYFLDTQLAEVLEERSRALASLRLEIERTFLGGPSPLRTQYLRTILLSSLILGLTSGWLTRDLNGLHFLTGARQVVPLLLESGEVHDAVTQYILGLYLYWESMASYIEPWEPPEQEAELYEQQEESRLALLCSIHDRHLAGTVHPVTGLAAGVFPLVFAAGRYYRRIVQGFPEDLECVESLRLKLEQWQPPARPEGLVNSHMLLLLADAYRAAALLMVHQAQSISDGRPDICDSIGARAAVATILRLLMMVSPGDPLLSSVGPFLIIAGSEFGEHEVESRQRVRWVASEVTRYTRVQAFSSALDLVEDVWAERACGHHITWLELMLQKRYTLSIA
ncbi:hypothetical protein GQ53DRAFT_846756 [Thozetella sp. PMI_491]|nr:hypothetical protein GQ53DRAFT_846756 [Thozetella sp. PMI_491]